MFTLISESRLDAVKQAYLKEEREQGLQVSSSPTSLLFSGLCAYYYLLGRECLRD